MVFPVYIKGWSTSMPGILQVRAGHKSYPNEDRPTEPRESDRPPQQIVGNAIRVHDHVNAAEAEIETTEEFDDYCPVICRDYDLEDGREPKAGQIFVLLVHPEEHRRLFGKRKPR